MYKVWTHEMIAYLTQVCAGNHIEIITNLVNKKFNKNFSVAAVKACMRRHDLHSHYLGQIHVESRQKFTEEEIKWLSKNRKGKTMHESVEDFNKTFHTKCTEAQIKNICRRYHIRSGLTGFFKKGNVPYNKGRKGVIIPGTEKGWFQKGHRPHNTQDVGKEIITFDGYIKIKVAQPDVWEFKHRYIWEKNYGPLKPDELVLFLDGNKLNCRLDNLVLSSKTELAVFNHKKRIQFGDKELNLKGIELTRLEKSLHDLSKKISEHEEEWKNDN